MQSIILVFLGGGLGSLLRYFLGRWVNALHTTSFPWGTLVVNIVACLLLGFIVGLADHRQIIPPAYRYFWAIGFCGGFSTFSTFSQETANLIETGLTLSAILYIAGSLLLCVTVTFGGLYISRHF